MLKVLVVDDEPIHRKGLSNVIRKYRPNYEVIETKDGLEALSVAMSQKVDVIITDIRMPNMDGLQLIENLGDRLKSIKVIILSVYGYFEYAQKAISLGAFEYMLKPFVESSVEEMLKRVEKSIEHEYKEKKEKEYLTKQLNSTLPVYLEHQMNRWITGNLSSGELEEIAGIFPYKGRGAVIVSELCSNSQLLSRYTEEDFREIKLNVKYWMKVVLDPLGHSISFFHAEKTNYMISIINSCNELNLASDENLDRFKCFINNLKAEYEFDVTVGIGSEHDDIFCNVKKSYEHAKTALSCKFFIGTGKVISQNEILYKPYKSVFSKYREEESLGEAILRLDRETSAQISDEIFNRIIYDGYPTPEQLTDSTYHIILNQVKRLEKFLEHEDYNKLVLEIKNKLYGCEGYAELRSIVRNILFNIIDICEYKKNSKNDDIIRKCKKYIDEHFSEELSLESIAQKFYFNPSYFSCFFKNYTGISFSDYLFKIRMQKAQELLKGTEQKVYEIAMKVGYKDPGYFNRIFKREFGVTPDEYRRITVKAV